MFNLVVLTGRLTSDVELKSTPNGVSVCSFSIANEVGYGESKKTSFVPVVAWRQTAEFVSKYFQKGAMIGIEGSIQTRKYQDKDGNNRTVFEVVANNVQFVESKKTNDDATETDPMNTVQNKLNSFAALVDEDTPF